MELSPGSVNIDISFVDVIYKRYVKQERVRPWSTWLKMSVHVSLPKVSGPGMKMKSCENSMVPMGRVSSLPSPLKN